MATVDYTPVHSLPSNIEADRSILGAMLLDNHAFNHAAEPAMLKVSEKRIGRCFAGVHAIFKASYGTLDALLERGQRITGRETHYEDLDNLTSGLQPSDLVIIAARPSMGKTAFALNIAENAAILDQKTVGIFSLEMSREALLLRLLCSRARVDSHKMRTGSLWRDDMHKVVRAMEE